MIAFARRLAHFHFTFIFLSTILLLTCYKVPKVMSLAATAASKKRIVVVGGGIQGTSVAYHLAERGVHVTLLESQQPASAASGKGGGFMARSWGDGSATQRLHELSFDLYETMAPQLGCTSYRKLPVLSVAPQYDGIKAAQKNKELSKILPRWLDGTAGRISALGWGDDTAQITPAEFVHKMLEAKKDSIDLVLGTCVGVETDQGSERGTRKITGVKYRPKDASEDNNELVPSDAVIISAGPWSCAAEDWFPASQLKLPMEGIKSTSIVWQKPPDTDSVDATALFCGEDNRYGTHCKYCLP